MCVQGEFSLCENEGYTLAKKWVIFVDKFMTGVHMCYRWQPGTDQ